MPSVRSRTKRAGRARPSAPRIHRPVSAQLLSQAERSDIEGAVRDHLRQAEDLNEVVGLIASCVRRARTLEAVRVDDWPLPKEEVFSKLERLQSAAKEFS